MRQSRFLMRTLRQDPGDADTASHRLMLRAGMMMQVVAGVYSYLPLALRSLNKIEAIIREEMNAADGQEVRMPALQPLELWQQTKRDEALGPILFRLRDRRERELVLGPTHEEVITSIAKAHVSSYRDLPLNLYQIQTKFRDEPRPRAGLMRGREFDMKDAYSFHADAESLDVTYKRMVQAYRNVFRRCGLPTLAVEADSGAIGGKDSHEFIMPADSGEDTVLRCPNCDYAANAERAHSVKAKAPEGEPRPLEKVSTPGVQAIPALAAFLDVPDRQTLKTVFYKADGRTVLVVIRGDLQVNEVKLKNYLKARDLRMATTEESRAAGLTPGYTSPIGASGASVLADESVTQGNNFVVGANEEGFHCRNANYPRDFTADAVLDIALAEAGQGCPRCGGVLEAVRGVEVGHVFKLGTAYSTALNATFQDAAGNLHPMTMGCYGIGVTRILAAAIEQNHDDKGIIFPAPIAPFHVHLVALNADNAEVQAAAERVEARLAARGYEVLYDDRVESAGVKFNDADLLGLPVRVVVSPRNLKQNVVEIKRRRDEKGELAGFDALESKVAELLDKDRLQAVPRTPPAPTWPLDVAAPD
ncbi:MAG: proline--tRNA ligase [SAR202 cluster bacterium]|nr:proline--tRNA ligase [SAR202 cluster bacterium]